MTAQVHEKLKYEGKKTSINFCPSLPENDPRIKILDDDEIGECDSIIFSTAGGSISGHGKLRMINFI